MAQWSSDRFSYHPLRLNKPNKLSFEARFAPSRGSFDLQIIPKPVLVSGEQLDPPEAQPVSEPVSLAARFHNRSLAKPIALHQVPKNTGNAYESTFRASNNLILSIRKGLKLWLNWMQHS
ncbi:hypothetical protein C7B82_19925 [Stenomitos frigidus ULC18]|uniref:Uncharacterized protein n=1 Tax=Stenomitos frigidus ULC18 TaxID=2107698 RepID=A0A2T1E186_9CYAN|nr:hypothetical protein C7B82_19925 [Stenomitos frigidus ULC18]